MTHTITQLVAVNVEVLGQMTDLLRAISSQSYVQNSGSDGSIGQHTRHIIEFYECFFEGFKDRSVNYDSRRRNPLIEADPETAIIELKHIIQDLRAISEDDEFTVMAQSFGDDKIAFPSSISREVLYLLEHTIHHMAIIRMLVKSGCPELSIPKEFGVAYSTLRYRAESSS